MHLTDEQRKHLWVFVHRWAAILYTYIGMVLFIIILLLVPGMIYSSIFPTHAKEAAQYKRINLLI